VIARLFAVVVGAAALLAGCQTPPPQPDRLTFSPARFADLPGWNDDRVVEAVPALRRSCAALDRATDNAPVVAPREWRPFCAALAALADGDESGLRTVIERELHPVVAANNGRSDGLFTGYYEPSLHGSRQRDARFTVPIYGLPADLVTVDLGQFRDSLKGQRIAGRVVAGELKPYEDRAAIAAGVLGDRAPVLLWGDSAVDVFFLHVQGSGRVTLPDGAVARLTYAGQNGHAYTAIGRTLIERGVLTPETVSMQSIRAWLVANPGEADAVMNGNASYIFFREIAANPAEGPPGAQGVPLTPGRSLAVDRGLLPFGLPLWLDVSYPAADGRADLPLRRLMVAQDTGGAIKGPVRGDVFWGWGDEAAAIAGRMKHRGRYWLLLPKETAARLVNAS
jgi:membrane-bound lytic murein transglycosylase A